MTLKTKGIALIIIGIIIGLLLSVGMNNTNSASASSKYYVESDESVKKDYKKITVPFIIIALMILVPQEYMNGIPGSPISTTLYFGPIEPILSFIIHRLQTLPM